MNGPRDFVMRGSFTCAFVVISVLVLHANPAVATNDATLDTPTKTPTTYFSSDEVNYQLAATSENAFDGRITWKLTSLHRTICRGEVAAKLDPGEKKVLDLRMQMPHVKPGVVLDVTFSASLYRTDEEKPVTLLQKDLWVFPLDPFVDRTEWLKDLKLKLFDPNGDTVGVFSDARIPFEELNSVAALRDAKNDGIIVVAEGVRKDSVAAEIITLAAQGHHILWLAPSDIQFDLPGSEGAAWKRPKELLFAGSDKISELDKRLDPHVWDEEEKSHSVELQITSGRKRTQLTVGKHKRGWTWLQANYSDPDGKLIFCGLGLVDVWETSPTPRYLVAKLLEQLDNRDSSSIDIDSQ